MKSLLTVMLCVVALVSLPAPAQQVKIGYIDIARIQRESKLAQSGAEKLKQEFATREQEVDDLYQKFTAMKAAFDKLPSNTPPDEMDRKRREFSNMAQRFEQTRRTFEEDLNRRKAEERQKFFNEIGAIVKKIAEAQKLDLVLQEAVYAGQAIDITDPVLKALDASAPGGNQ